MGNAITLVAADISADQDRGAWIDSTKVAGVSLSIGDVVRLDTNNKLQKAQAISAANARVYGMVVGGPNTPYGETTIAAGDYPAVCIAGNVFVGPSATVGAGKNALTAGQFLFLSDGTAGGLEDGSSTPAWNVIVARAEGPDSIYLMPGISAPASSYI